MSIFGNLFDFNNDGHMSIAEQAADYIAFRNMMDRNERTFDDLDFSIDYDDIDSFDTGDLDDF